MRSKQNLKKIHKIIRMYDGLDHMASIQDLLTDIMHYCDEKNRSFSEACEYATMVHYNTETDEWVRAIPLTKLPLHINREFGDSTDHIQELMGKRYKKGV